VLGCIVNKEHRTLTIDGNPVRQEKGYAVLDASRYYSQLDGGIKVRILDVDLSKKTRPAKLA
jgi:hypothetical protein